MYDMYTYIHTHTHIYIYMYMYMYIYIYIYMCVCVYVCNVREQGFRVWVSGSRQSRVEDLKIPRVRDVGLSVLGLGFTRRSAGFRVQGLGFIGFRVSVPGLLASRFGVSGLSF